MSKLMLSSDLHLGHKAICRYRTKWSDAEEHHNEVYENLATGVGKRDTLMLLGDIAFTEEWLRKVDEIRCKHKILILGNHCTDRNIDIRMLGDVYDKIHSLYSKRNNWFSHCPIHPQELRGRNFNIHGHLHSNIVEKEVEETVLGEYPTYTTEPDLRYINVCVEHTDYKPISYEDLMRERL